MLGIGTTGTNPLMNDPTASLSNARPRPDADDGRRFRELMGQGPTRADTRKPEEQAREAAEQLLSVSFIQPVLKQVREMNDAPPPWGPTQAEKQFGPMLDAKLADQLIKAARLPIVERLSRDLNRSELLNNLGPQMPEKKGFRS
ncbi:MAG: hypothetical protein JJU33_07030 [Phycisphaerales bacterium]|nr:hypothetical protein [Phycisphaerales bacterium]